MRFQNSGSASTRSHYCELAADLCGCARRRCEFGIRNQLSGKRHLTGLVCFPAAFGSNEMKAQIASVVSNGQLWVLEFFMESGPVAPYSSEFDSSVHVQRVLPPRRVDGIGDRGGQNCPVLRRTAVLLGFFVVERKSLIKRSGEAREILN